MHLPEPIPPSAHDETFAGVTYHIRGELVPELQIEIGDAAGDVRAPRAAVEGDTARRSSCASSRAGSSARSPASTSSSRRPRAPGRIAFSRDSPGQCVPLHLDAGRGPRRARAPVHRRDRQPRLQLRAHQGRPQHAARRLGLLHGQVPGDRRRRARVAARPRQRVPRASSEPASSSTSRPAPGSTRTRPSSSKSVTLGLKTGIFGGGGKLTWNRFTGPGRLAIQTLFVAPLEGVGSGAAAAEGGVAGALISGLVRADVANRARPGTGPMSSTSAEAPSARLALAGPCLRSHFAWLRPFVGLLPLALCRTPAASALGRTPAASALCRTPAASACVGLLPLRPSVGLLPLRPFVGLLLPRHCSARLARRAAARRDLARGARLPARRRRAMRRRELGLLVQRERGQDHVERHERPALECGGSAVARDLCQSERRQGQRSDVDRSQREGERRRQRERHQHQHGEQERGDLGDRVFDDRDREVRLALARPARRRRCSRPRCPRSRRSRARRTPARGSASLIAGASAATNQSETKRRRRRPRPAAARGRRRATAAGRRAPRPPPRSRRPPRPVSCRRAGRGRSMSRSTISRLIAPTIEIALTWWLAGSCEPSESPSITMMNTATSSSVAVSRGRPLEKRITPSSLRRAPTTITRPRTSSAFARIEPTIAVCATTSSPFCEREDDDEQLRQVAERRLQHARHRRADALAELLGRERHDPREAGERDRRDREARHRAPTARSCATPATTAQQQRSRRARALPWSAPSCGRPARLGRLSDSRARGRRGRTRRACSALKKRSRSMSRWTSSIGLPVCSA